MKLQYMLTDEQIVDMLMKYLSNKKFKYFRNMLVLVDITNLARRNEASWGNKMLGRISG